MRRWSPLNQSLYFGYKVHLAGLLLNHKGDRVAMANSVETRYPFLDEDVIALTSRLAPRWKLRGLSQDKYILRQAAARILPHEVAFRPKGMFRAPLAESFFTNPPPYVRQLMSRQALLTTGYFDPAAVRRDYDLVASGQAAKLNVFLKMGLSGVLATQLWHHIYIGTLCELPDHMPMPDVARPSLPPEAA
jgi:asparagine synthase (glutamine-hydrolysing)